MQEPGDSPHVLAVHSLLTAPPAGQGGGGLAMGKLWALAMGSPGKRKEEVLSGCLLQHARDAATASSMWGTIAAVRIAEDMGWIAHHPGSDPHETCPK